MVHVERHYNEFMLGASASATGAAAVIRHPLAWTVAGAVAAFIADPEKLQRAAGEWGNSSGELGGLKGQIDTLWRQLEKKGDWEGNAKRTTVRDAVDEKVTKFGNELMKASQNHDDMRKSLDETVRSYLLVGGVMGSVASTMAIWKVIVTALRLLPHPGAKLMAEGANHQVMTGLAGTTTRVSMKKKYLIGLVVALLTAQNAAFAEQAGLFEEFKATVGPILTFGLAGGPKDPMQEGEGPYDWDDAKLYYDNEKGVTGDAPKLEA